MEEACKNFQTHNFQTHHYFHGQTKINLPKSHGQGSQSGRRTNKLNNYFIRHKPRNKNVLLDEKPRKQYEKELYRCGQLELHDHHDWQKYNSALNKKKRDKIRLKEFQNGFSKEQIPTYL